MPNRQPVRAAIRAMRRGLLWCVLGAIVLGAVVSPAAAVVGQAAPILIALMMVGLGFSMGLGRLRGLLPRLPRLLLVVALQIPANLALAWALSRLVESPSARAGVRVLGAMPVEAISGAMVHAVGGDLPSGLAITALSMLASAFLLPMLVRAPGMTAAVVDPLETLVWIVLGFLAPVLLAAAIRDAEPGAGAWEAEAAGLAALAVLLLGFAAGGHAGTHGSDEKLDVVFLAVAFALGGFLIGYGIARVLRAGPGQARAIVLTTGMRDFGTAVGFSAAFLRGDAPGLTATYAVAVLVLGPLFAQADRQGLLAGWLPAESDGIED
jgi:predicted Na+-dependent transporter